MRKESIFQTHFFLLWIKWTFIIRQASILNTVIISDILILYLKSTFGIRNPTYKKNSIISEFFSLIYVTRS